MNKWDDAHDLISINFSVKSLKLACGYRVMTNAYNFIHPLEDRIAKINILEMFTR
jgi:hypothetical protein